MGKEHVSFNVCLGNPPYQIDDGGNGASAKPVYQLFVDEAKKITDNSLCLVIPARWYAGGKGLDQFRSTMLEDDSIKTLVDFPNSADCFSGVNIAGGVCYFVRNSDYHGPCKVVNIHGNTVTSTKERYLNEFPLLVRDNTALSIIESVKKKEPKSLDEMVKSRNCFNIPTTMKFSSTKNPGDLFTISSKGTGYVSPQKITDKNGLIDRFKVVATYAMSGGNKPGSDGKYQVLSSLQVLKPQEVCSETYLVLGDFDNLNEAENFKKYMESKFVRFLLLQALTSIHITKDKFCFVPVLDFREIWTDQKLNNYFDLGEDEVSLINSKIREM